MNRNRIVSYRYTISDSMNDTMDIDGSVLEGGGQVLRMAIAFSVLQRIPVRVFNIRAGRSKPGLSPQHLKGLELARDMTDGQLIGAHPRSMEVIFKPRKLKPGQYLADTGTAGSVSLIVQMLLPCALFSSETTVLDLRGGTNAEMAPQIDYTTTVFLTLLKRFGALFHYDLILRGFYPKGGGRLKVEIPPVKHLIPVEMVEPGSIKRIWGTSFTAGNCPLIYCYLLCRDSEYLHNEAVMLFNIRTWPDLKYKVRRVSKLMAESAERLLGRNWGHIRPCIEQRKEHTDTAVGTGSGIYIFGETTSGCIYAGTALGKRDVKAEVVGETAAKELDKSISSEICVDDHSQDQMIILMALAKGTSRILCGPISLHTKTAIYVAELMTKAKFTIHPQDRDRNIIECDGIGLENDSLK